MQNIYKWHIDFIGCNGLISAASTNEVREKLFNQFEFDEFSRDNLQIRHLYSMDYAVNIVTNLAKGEVVTLNRNKLIEKVIE